MSILITIFAVIGLLYTLISVVVAGFFIFIDPAKRNILGYIGLGFSWPMLLHVGRAF